MPKHNTDNMGKLPVSVFAPPRSEDLPSASSLRSVRRKLLNFLIYRLPAVPRQVGRAGKARTVTALPPSRLKSLWWTKLAKLQVPNTQDARMLRRVTFTPSTGGPLACRPHSANKTIYALSDSFLVLAEGLKC